MESRTASLAGRAAAVVALLAGFYLLTSAMLALIAVFLLAQVYSGHYFPFLSLGAALAGFSVLRSIFTFGGPKFVPPGPEILEAQEPELFALLRRTAESVGTPMPRHVYIAPDVNAFVTETGGYAGLGGRRVMGLGLGLVSALDVSQLQGVIAHELGHYVGGDVALGGFIYGARRRLIIATISLSRSWFGKPFAWYLRLFLRVSRGVSRAQEIAADETAARCIGPDRMKEALRRTAEASVLFDAFLDLDVAPMAERGMVPDRFYEVFEASMDERRRELGSKLADALSAMSTDPFDTHPSHSDRIALLDKLPAEPSMKLDNRPGRALFRGFDRLEHALLTRPQRDGRSLVPTPFDEAAPIAFPPAIERAAASVCAHWAQLGRKTQTYLELAIVLADAAQREPIRYAKTIAPELADIPLIGAEGERAMQVARRLLLSQAASLYAAGLLANGGRLRREPGKPSEIFIGEERFTPFVAARTAIDDPDELPAFRAKLEAARAAVRGDA